MILTRTKKIITFGPSLDKYLEWGNNFEINRNVIEKYNLLIESGVDCIRFNMSHDNIHNHEKRFASLRELNRIANKKTSILIDTKGPEIRVCEIKDNTPILNGEIITIITNNPNLIGNKNCFAVSDSTKTYNLANDVNKNDLIYIADGKLVLKVLDINENKTEIKAISISDEFILSSNRRVNLVNKKYHLPFISEYDNLVIQKATLWKADFIALSFLSNKNELESVKKIIQSTDNESQIKLIGKIENLEAINNIDSLIDACDGIMVARGDLALEIGYEKVPYYEDIIVKKCNEKFRISIIATQILDSLENSILPTRAETYDCYNVVKLNANAAMLSGETASGVNPLNAVIQMNKIIEFAENIDFKNFKINTNSINIISNCNNYIEFSKNNDNAIGKFYNYKSQDLWMTLLKKIYFVK